MTPTVVKFANTIPWPKDGDDIVPSKTAAVGTVKINLRSRF